MDPCEKRRVAAIEPVDGGVDHLVGGALHAREIEPLEFAQVEPIVVGVEALGEPPARVEHERADERAGAVPARMEPFGERRLGVCEGGRPVQAQPVPGGIESRHHRRVRR